MAPASAVAALAQPITLKLSGKTIPNRIYRSAQSEYAASWDDNDVGARGKPLPAYVKRMQDMADGGVGLIQLGNIPIHRDHMENEGNAVLDPDNTWDPVEAFRPAITAAKSRGALCIGQLQYPGRQTPDFINPHPKSSSSEQLQPSMSKSYGPPTPLSIDEIKDLYRRYAWASEQLMKAGADGIILHACHGYIITQFLSPLINKRTDHYGGSLENRARFLLELIAAIKARCPVDRFIVAVKLNCSDFIDGGATFSDYCTVARWLEDAGVDFFDISGGTYASPAWRGNMMPEMLERESCRQRGSYFVEWAAPMKKLLKRAVLGTTGGWRDAHRMAEAVEQGDVDMVGLARPLRVEPDLPKKMIRGEARESHL